MNKSTLTLLLLFFSGSLFSQTMDNTITYRKVFGGYKFEQNGQALSPKNMLDIFQPGLWTRIRCERTKCKNIKGLGLF